jgi:hypothetical protein
MKTPSSLARRVRSARGQSIIEFALVLPLCLIVVLGVIETAFALFDQHIVTKLTREGSNLISRDTSLQDAAAVLRNMSTRPVDFNSRSAAIFSVLKKGGTSGTANYNRLILYQRFKFGSLSASSRINTAGGGSFGGPPNYEAANSDNNTALRVTNLPANLVTEPGGHIYVTEIFTTHDLITPFDRFGINVPNQLYSIAYF